MSPALSASKLERNRSNKWVSETIGSRNVDDSITTTIIVMQRLHEMDTTGYLLKKEGLRVHHVCIPAEISKDVKPAELSAYYVNGLFDPIRKSKERLLIKKVELGSYGYAGQMQQRPSPEEGGIIKSNWFQIVNKALPIPAEAPIDFQMDTAYTDDTDNDPTAVLSYYVQNNNLYITHATSVWKEFPDLIRWLPEYARGRGYKPQSTIHVEPKASGKSVVQTAKDETDLNIIESVPPKEDKVTRLHRVSPKIEAGRVFLHEGAWNESFINQVTSFPNAEHDDEVDCLTAIIIRELMNVDDFDYEEINEMI
jgi:predicted phage terminase large subunit-like protein